MSTKERFNLDEIKKQGPYFSTAKTIIETAFYSNSVVAVNDLKTAYELAKKNKKTIVTDQPIIHTKELGLPDDAKMLVDNHGKVVGRTTKARRVLGTSGVDDKELEALLREAVYNGQEKDFYQTEVVVGLDEAFMVKAHLMLPKGFEVNLLSYMLNFQVLDQEYRKRYADSKKYGEDDIYIYCDPEWQSADYPDGLVIFDPKRNVAAVLGLRYFGELKKSTLTLAWALAHRNGYTACHGGEKTFHFEDKPEKVFAFYGLSGSGKSTLTHAKHDNKFKKITILHDDAFVIEQKTGRSIALEPAYFDKTSDYLPGSKEMRYFTTVMNVGVTRDPDGKKVLVTEDLRNGNGRTIKSRFSSKNRVNHEDAPLDAIFWIMKDDSLPPVVELSDPVLAATFGLTLATKRSTAEYVTDKAREQLVIEPFADPFRVYPLHEDYMDFKGLFEKNQVDCYIINTDSFNGTDIGKSLTLEILEMIASDKATWTSFLDLPQMSYLKLAGYEVDANDTAYLEKLKQRLKARIEWIAEYEKTHPDDQLPVEIKATLTNILAKL